MNKNCNNSFYTDKELLHLGLKTYGANVLISRFARFYGSDKISIGDNVRIDDFCILSGEISIGSNIHISAHCMLYGSHGIVMEDFAGLSPRTIVFSASDDFSGNYMIGPMVPTEYTNVKGAKVIIRKYAQVGAGSIILPGVIFEEGSVAGAMSLVVGNLNSWTIYAGIPAKKTKERKKKIIQLSENLNLKKDTDE